MPLPVSDHPLELLVWTPDMAVGIPTIDNEHAIVVALYNDLVHALQRGASLVTNRGILQTLRNYLLDHMDREEGYIRQHAFPDADAHIRDHRGFADALEALTTQPPDDAAAVHAGRLLRGWIVHHILVSDRTLFDHVRRTDGATSAPPASHTAQR